MRDSNIDSLENLKTNLRINRIDPEKVALVFQYNKRDLPNVDSVETTIPNNNPTCVSATRGSLNHFRVQVSQTSVSVAASAFTSS